MGGGAGLPSLFFSCRKCSTIHCQGTRQAGVPAPKALQPPKVTPAGPAEFQRAPLRPAAPEISQSPSSQAVQALSQSCRGLEWSQELNKPGEAGLETSRFFWAGSLLFIAAQGWRRVLQAPPVTGVFGGDEPGPGNPLRGQLGSQGAGRGLGSQVQPASRTLSPPPLGSAPPAPSRLPPRELPSPSRAQRPGY